MHNHTRSTTTPVGQTSTVPLDWRTMQPTILPVLHFWAGGVERRRTIPSPMVFILACKCCGQRWCGGSPLALDPSPCCGATLQIVRLWDLTEAARLWAKSLRDPRACLGW